MSLRKGIIFWSEHSTDDTELDGVSQMHSITLNVSIRTGWSLPIYSQLVRRENVQKKNAIKKLDS